MWKKSVPKLISLISLLFLFIKSGAGLVYLKMVRKHMQAGCEREMQSALACVKGLLNPDRVVFDPDPPSFLLLIFGWIGIAVYAVHLTQAFEVCRAL